MADKKLGIVKWFGGYNSNTERENNFGFIETLEGNDVFVHKNNVKGSIYKGELVLFNLIKQSNGKFSAENVVSIYNINYIFDSDECLQVVNELKESDKQRSKLPTRCHVEFCLKMYSENPSLDIEEELCHTLSDITSRNEIDLPMELVIKPKFWKNASIQNKINAVKTYFNELSDDMIYDAILQIIIYRKNEEFNDFLKQHIHDKKLFDIMKNSLEGSQNFGSANYYYDYYCNAISEIVSATDIEKSEWLSEVLNLKKKFSILLNRYKENPSPELENKLAELAENLTIEISDLPENLILKNNFWNLSSDDQKFELFKQKAKTLSPEEFNSIAVKFINYTKFGEEVINYLRDNPTIWLSKKINDELKILLVYAVAKDSALDENLLKFIDLNTSSPRVKIICTYIKAAQAEDKFTKQQYFDEAENIFNSIFKLDEDNLENFPNLDLILPKCGHNTKFCEARLWPKVKENYDTAMRGYCPRNKHGYDIGTDCIRFSPCIKSPLKNWSLLEFFEVLNIQPTVKNVHPREFVAKLCGAFNRLYELLERLKCRNCGKYMHFNKIYSKLENLAVYMSTVAECNEHSGKIYLSHCWNCHKIIDSRDCHIKTKKGYYYCIHCGAGDKADKAGLGKICPNCGSHNMNKLQRGYRYECQDCHHEINTHWE